MSTALDAEISLVSAAFGFEEADRLTIMRLRPFSVLTPNC